ncbi:hypothetical protein B0H11DRAFT_2057457 [Mycena galericulata]|nr:hypothetical protein B0H11DRAFT_2057457 [Mycena galericulata]
MSSASTAVAVYCGSSMGTEKAFTAAATCRSSVGLDLFKILTILSALGHAIGEAKRPLVYGGGNKGIMGVVSGAVLERGGKVTGIVPYAMVAAGGESEKVKSGVSVILDEAGREQIEHIVVDSMHERKVDMAKRVAGFFGLPGGFGTFEEVLEVTTWTQLGIHNKPVVVLNVLSFFEPLRQLINNGIDSSTEHECFNWGEAALKALDSWKRAEDGLFDWTARVEGKHSEALDST